MAVAETGADLLGCRDQDREIGLALLRERGRQRDQDRVGVPKLVVLHRRANASLTDERGESLRGDVDDVAFSPVERADNLFGNVDQEYRAARGGERMGERDADVTSPDDGGVPRLRLRLSDRLCFGPLVKHWSKANQKVSDPFGSSAVAVELWPLGRHSGVGCCLRDRVW